jgi:hypothetical protein
MELRNKMLTPLVDVTNPEAEGLDEASIQKLIEDLSTMGEQDEAQEDIHD